MVVSAKPTLSIITVTAFDVHRLERTLESLQQDLHDVELIIVCPQSDEITIQSVKSFSEMVNYPVRAFHDVSIGIYSAMNVGLKYAHGRYIIFWNSGDSANDLAALQEFIHFLKFSDSHWGITQAAFSWRGPQVLTNQNVRSFALQEGGYISHQAVFVKSDTLRNMGGFDTQFKVAADTLLITKLWLKHEVVFFPQKVVNVEFPNFSGKSNRRGRFENFVIAIKVLPFGYKYFALKSALTRELGYLYGRRPHPKRRFGDSE